MEGGTRLFHKPPAGTQLIGFYPAKYILREIYTRIVNEYGPKAFRAGFDPTRYSHVVAAIDEFASKYNRHDKIRSIPLSVLLGRKEGSDSNKTFITDLGLETNTDTRRLQFYMFDPLILPTDLDIDVVINASGVDQYFIYIATPTEGLYHMSIPINPTIKPEVSTEPSIHYKEDVPDRDGRPEDQHHYYEFVPFDRPNAYPSRSNTIQYPNPSGINLQQRQTRDLTPKEAAEELAAAKKLSSSPSSSSYTSTSTSTSPSSAKTLTPEQEQKKAAAAARKAEKEAAEAQRLAEAEAKAKEAAKAKAEAEAQRLAEAEAKAKAEAVRKAAEEAALTPEERAKREKKLAALATLKRKKGGRSTRRKPRRALRKTRKAYI